MKNAGGLPQDGRQPEVQSLFITLWDLSLPTLGKEEAGKKVQPRSVEFPLVASGAQLWVRAEGAAGWTLGPVAEAEVLDVDEDTQRVPPTVVDFAALLPSVKGNRFEIGVEPGALQGVQFGGYYESEESYVSMRDAQRLVAVVQWGTAQWREMYEAFADCSNMQITATDVPDLTQCESLHSAFMGSGVEEGFAGWNVGSVVDMSAMFYGCSRFVGKSLAEWDVRNVESMAMMFMECENFDGKMGRWNVVNVQDFTSIFSGCSAFRGRGVERWQVQEEAEREGAFDGCFSLLEGQPAWMGETDEGDEGRYDDDEAERGERVRKFRPNAAADD